MSYSNMFGLNYQSTERFRRKIILHIFFSVFLLIRFYLQFNNYFRLVYLFSFILLYLFRLILFQFILVIICGQQTVFHFHYIFLNFLDRLICSEIYSIVVTVIIPFYYFLFKTYLFRIFSNLFIYFHFHFPPCFRKKYTIYYNMI